MFPSGNYMFKVNNGNSRTRCEICSKLTIKTLERHQWQGSKYFSAFCVRDLTRTLDVGKKISAVLGRYFGIWYGGFIKYLLKVEKC